MTKNLLLKICEHGLTQHEIAKRSGIPQSTINRILKGRQAEVLYCFGKKLEALLEELEAFQRENLPEA